MTPLQHRNPSARLRSGLFVFVFAPIALVFLGSSMVDVQALTSVDQPLTSVEGLIGMVLASLLLALIAPNCKKLSAGVVVTFTWSIVVGMTQFLGATHLPFPMKSSVGAGDVITGISWCLYPMCMSLILGAYALTIKPVQVRADKSTRVPLAHVHRHGFDTTVALPAAVTADTLMVAATPSGTTNVTTMDLEEVTEGFEPMHWLALGAGITFTVFVVSTRQSITDMQIVSQFILMLPTYVVLPVWTSLTGDVIVPGPSLLTKMVLASPLLAALEVATGCVSMGVLRARVWALKKLGADDDSTTKEGPAEG